MATKRAGDHIPATAPEELLEEPRAKGTIREAKNETKAVILKAGGRFMDFTAISRSSVRSPSAGAAISTSASAGSQPAERHFTNTIADSCSCAKPLTAVPFLKNTDGIQRDRRERLKRSSSRRGPNASSWKALYI